MAEMTFQQAVALAREKAAAGHWTEAEAVFHQILGQLPGHAESLHQLGLLALQQGNLTAAIDRFNQAITSAPDRAGYHVNLAAALRATGQIDQAVASCRRAVELAPTRADVAHQLGAALLQQGDATAAVEAFRRAVELNPEAAEYHTHLGIALDRDGRPEEAAAAHRQAIALRADLAIAHTHLGVSLSHLDQFEEALDCHQRAVALDPRLAVAHNNLGVVQRSLGDIDGSVASLRQAIALTPDDAEAHLNLAQTLLLAGRFAEGWPEYEWRARLDPVQAGRPPFAQPRWDGTRQPGKTLFVWSDQGYGDIIQFSRFLPILADSGMRVVLGCRPALRRLQESIPGVDAFVTEGGSLPAFDFHVPLSSLPLALGDRMADIPATVPYLSPPPAVLEAWRQRFGLSSRLRIGLVWAGQPRQRFDRRRSLTLGALAPLFAATGDMATFFSLQLGEAAAQLEPSPVPAEDLAPHLSDFADTAAAICQLDLVITVDTAVAHLAGALGRPVWTLISSPPDWRYQMDREDSPWYPTMRLFRQSRPGDWADPIARAASALGTVARKGRDFRSNPV